MLYGYEIKNYPDQQESTKAAGNVVLGSFLGRIKEYFLGKVMFDQFPKVEESGIITDATGLLEIMGYNQDGE